MINNSFYLCLERGRQAEVMVMNAFRSMGYDVMDVTKNPAFWKQDVDLLIWDHDGTQYKFEVKADWSIGRTGNIVLEMKGKTGGKGWYLTTEATHLVFCDMQNRIGYIARTTELKEYTEHEKNLDHANLSGCECLLVNINDYGKFNKIML